MKKNVFKLMALLLIAIVGVSITSCKGDDGEQTTGTSQNQSNAGSLVGTWVGQTGSATLTLTFNSNGSGNWMSASGSKKTGSGALSYEVTGTNTGKIIIRGEFEYLDGKDMNAINGTYSIEGNKMLFEATGLGKLTLTKQ